MKKETYFCNLCGEERDKADLLAIYHTGCWIAVKHGHPKWNDSHRHICSVCVKMVADVASEKGGSV